MWTADPEREPDAPETPLFRLVGVTGWVVMGAVLLVEDLVLLSSSASLWMNEVALRLP